MVSLLNLIQLKVFTELVSPLNLIQLKSSVMVAGFGMHLNTLDFAAIYISKQKKIINQHYYQFAHAQILLVPNVFRVGKVYPPFFVR